MRSSTSRHDASIRTRVFDIWPGLPVTNFRPLLNIQELAYRLGEVEEEDASDYLTLPTNEKKRRAGSHRLRRVAKRVKTSQGDINHDCEESEESGSGSNYVWPGSRYPSGLYCGNAGRPSKNTKVVPVFRHVFEIQYTTITHPNNVMAPHERGWHLEEKNLEEILEGLRVTSSEPRVIDFGGVNITKYSDRLVVSSVHIGQGNVWLLLLPSLHQNIDLSGQDIFSPAAEDVMMACYTLQLLQRVKIDARLKMIVLPSGAYDTAQQQLPLQLQVVINISLVIPIIFEPLPRTQTKQKQLEIEDAQRQVLEFIYPSECSTPDSFDGVNNIPFFYSILRPAPPLPSLEAEDAMQPAGLLPTLLPFQRRSVAWLLDREGKTVTPGGDIVPKAETTNFTFWDKIEEGNHTWYLNRLSGVLSCTRPSTVPVLGGILAEEPGLGKTLETIALILLNPAPERNPTLKSWDPESQLEVKAIKTTLIVTPPALASQWADELAAHAPSLRVLVYSGWAKLKVPITQSQADDERSRRLHNKSEAKRKTAPKSQAKKRVIGSKKKIRDGDGDGGDEIIDSDEDNAEILDWCSYVNTFDVVITTYQVLRSDLNVARAVPVRPRREDVVYLNVDRPRSPLVMCEWNRVVMDEVQMVSGGKIEDMVSLIPRVSSFAVSGTPARRQVADLIHILKFLRADCLVGSPRLWSRLVSEFGAAQFAAFFQIYAIRTVKLHLEDELTIPQQTRYLVGINLGRVEKHVYDQALEAILLDIGLDARGVAASEGWQVDGALLRSSLRRLRGICTHPQVGNLQRTGDKLYKPGGVKTIDEVLQNMRDQNWRNMMDDFKLKVQALIRYAQLQQHDERDHDHRQHAIETLLSAEKEALALTEEVKTALAEHATRGAALSDGAATTEGARDSDLAEGGQDTSEKGKARASQSAGAEENVNDDFRRTAAGEEHSKKRGALQHRLRECQLALHRVKFLQGDMYHLLGVSHSPSEDAAYAAAEEIRRGLLKGTEEDAKRAMAQLSLDATNKSITHDALIIEAPYLDESEIVSLLRQRKPPAKEHSKSSKSTLYKRAAGFHKLMEEANEIIDEILNEQSELLWEWRTHITALLTQKLSAGEDEADGQEYQRTLDDQGEAETYLQSYTALLADRRQALLNERTLLAAHDIREKKLRHTKAAIRAANTVAEKDLDIYEDIDLQPEHEVLYTQLSERRKGLLERLNGRAIKSVLIGLHAGASRLKKDSDAEKIIVKDAVDKLRKLIADQGVLLDNLDADLALIRKAFNQRILYFRQLQEISDSVAEVTWETTVADALKESSSEKTELEAKINTTRARQRYLEHLAKNKDEGITDEDDESCILCRNEFIRGFITLCAHVFCEACMKAWIQRKEGKTCPVCRVPIDIDAAQRFTVGKQEQQPPPPPRMRLANEPTPQSRRQISYNTINPKLLDKIQAMGSFGDFGSKIQTLVRHLLYLQVEDPGAKSIVFSAWADSLHIVESALTDNGIRCVRIDQNTRVQSASTRFKSDPDILVLLLHGERENAGLNVTCASRVFLLESVVHHSFEIQAIARIDRMGQTRSTEVFCYYAEDTVERNILDLAARQGLSLYTKENSASTLDVSSLGVSEGKKAIDSPVTYVQKGDFIFKIDDMLAIMFPHMYEDIEYLVPPEESVPVQSGGALGPKQKQAVSAGGGRANAIAGPSRLH